MPTIASQQGELKLGDLLDPNVIYESPDGGKTLFSRPIGAKPDPASWHDRHSMQQDHMREHDLWMRVLSERLWDPDIASLLEQARMLYLLRNTAE